MKLVLAATDGPVGGSATREQADKMASVAVPIDRLDRVHVSGSSNDDRQACRGGARSQPPGERNVERARLSGLPTHGPVGLWNRFATPSNRRRDDRRLASWVARSATEEIEG